MTAYQKIDILCLADISYILLQAYLQIAQTNINMMLEPGHVSTYLAEMNHAGEYLIVCNEYCGKGHAFMFGTLKVVDENAI